MLPIVSSLATLLRLSAVPITTPPTAQSSCPTRGDGPYPVEWNVTQFLYFTYNEPLPGGGNRTVGQVNFTTTGGGYKGRPMSCIGTGPEYPDPDPNSNNYISPWRNCGPIDGLPDDGYVTSFSFNPSHARVYLNETSRCGTDPMQLQVLPVHLI